MATNKLQWKRIAMGDKLPCQSFLRKKNGEILKLSTVAGVTVGQDCYYLPVDEVINVIKDYPVEESEDEKVRKALLEMVHDTTGDSLWVDYNVHKEDAIAWLEKQGEKEKFTKKELDCIRGYREKAIRRLHELEQQGEQKPAKNIVETWKDMRLEVYQQASGNRHESNVSDDTTKMFSLNDIDEIVEKMSEQNHADKVEPKFKVGDWVIDNNIKTPFLITDTSNGKYDVVSIYGNDFVFSFNEVERFYHLWTIQDAKDGDVVVEKSDGTIGIFQSIGHHPDGGSYNDPSHCFLHCHCDDEFFYADFENGNEIDSDDLVPATKEQRDLLFQKMKEAGYEWDADKKELRKIEQKPAEWSEEDENLLKLSIENLTELKDRFGEEYGKVGDCIVFLESIKDRLQSQQQQQWKPSKEQIMALRWVLNHIPYDSHKEEINGLLEQLLKLYNYGENR